MSKNTIVAGDKDLGNDGTKGGIFRGDRHSAASGGIAVEVEGGGSVLVEDFEPIIVPLAVNSNQTVSFDGKKMKPKEVISKINTDFGGVPIKKEGGVIDAKAEIKRLRNIREKRQTIDSIILENGGVIKSLIEKSNKHNFIDFVENTLYEDAFYDKHSVVSISKSIIKVDEILLKFSPQNPIITKFGELAYFYPHAENILRDGLEKAYIKYAAHLITRSDSKGRTIDASKERAIGLVEDALVNADNRYIDKKEDGSESIIYVKHHIQKKGLAAMALVIEMNGLGQLRMVSFMPDRKKIGNTWLEASPILYHAELGYSANQISNIEKEVKSKVIVENETTKNISKKERGGNIEQPIKVKAGSVVITRNAALSNETHEYNGEQLTNKEILSKINHEIGGGVEFAEGGKIENNNEPLIPKYSGSSDDKTYNIHLAKKILDSLGIDATFASYSHTPLYGISVYFSDKNNVTFRISDHHTGIRRAEGEEVMLYFDQNEMGFGGKKSVKSNIEKNKKTIENLSIKKEQDGKIGSEFVNQNDIYFATESEKESEGLEHDKEFLENYRKGSVNFKLNGLVDALELSKENLKTNGLVLKSHDKSIIVLAYNTGGQEFNPSLYNLRLIRDVVAKIDNLKSDELVSIFIDRVSLEKFDEKKIDEYKEAKFLIICNQNEVVYNSNDNFESGGSLDCGCNHTMEGGGEISEWDFEFTGGYSKGQKFSEQQVETIDVYDDNIYSLLFINGSVFDAKTSATIGLLSITDNVVKLAVILGDNVRSDQKIIRRLQKLAEDSNRIIVENNSQLRSEKRMYPFLLVSKNDAKNYTIAEQFQGKLDTPKKAFAKTIVQDAINSGSFLKQIKEGRDVNGVIEIIKKNGIEVPAEILNYSNHTMEVGGRITEKTVENLSKKLIERIGGKITYKSPSGSVYIELNNGETVRVSDHQVDSYNPQSTRNTGTTNGLRGKRVDFNFDIYHNDNIDAWEDMIRSDSDNPNQLLLKSNHTMEQGGEIDYDLTIFPKKVFDKIKDKLGIKQFKYLGSGIYGSAFKISRNKVLKVTKDLKEYEYAKKIQGLKNKHIANIYDTFWFKSEDRYYAVIIKEYCNMDNEKLDVIIDDFLKKTGNEMSLSFVSSEYLQNEISKDDFYKYFEIYKNKNGQHEEFAKQWVEMVEELKQKGIVVKDLHKDNVGYKIDTDDLCLIDAGYGTGYWLDKGMPIKDEKLFKKGGEINHEETYKKWKSLVNISKSELENFYNSKEGKEAGLGSEKANELGIHSGRESAKWILKMKDTPHQEWTETMWDWANRQISFISRMSGNKGGLYDDKGNKTRKHTSLLIWGHNPEKLESGGQIMNFTQYATSKGYPSDYDVLEHGILGESGSMSKRSKDFQMSKMEDRMIANTKAHYEFEQDILNGLVVDADNKITKDSLIKRYNDFDNSKIQSRICQIDSQIRTIENLGRMSHLESGKLKPKYQKTVDLYNKEKSSLIPKLKYESGGKILTDHNAEFEKLKTQLEMEDLVAEIDLQIEDIDPSLYLTIDVKNEYPKDDLFFYNEKSICFNECEKRFDLGGSIGDAENEAKKIWESLSDEQRQELIEGGVSVINGLLEEYKQNVIKLESEKSELTEQRNKIYEQERGEIGYDLKSKLFNDRDVINKQLKVLEVEIRHAKNVEKAFANGGRIIEFEDKKGLLNSNIPSFIEVDTSVISFNEETILADEMPKYIPLMDEAIFKAKGFVFDAIRIAKDTYIVAVNGYKENAQQSRADEVTNGKKHPTVSQQGYVLLTLDQLVLTNDYYLTRAKALAQKKAEEQSDRNEAYYDKLPIEQRERHLNQRNFYSTLPVAVKKKVTQSEYEALDLAGKEAFYKPFKKVGSERLTSKLADDRMWVSFHAMYERFLDPTAVQPQPRYANSIVFEYWTKFRDMMQFKIKDIKMQREVDSEQYKKALETSFGDVNTEDLLFNKYGILVKRQDGKKIEPTHIEEIESSWVKVQKSFGNLTEWAKKTSLKISHTNQTYVFASKAIGMYVPKMNTIAVSSKYGYEQFANTFAQEVAHYIDNKLGEQKGKRWLTDDYESTAGILAFEFRRLLNKKTESNYLNATKECFARALQQYFAIQNFGENAEMKFSNSPLDKLTFYFNEDYFVNKENYYDVIKPLVEKFLSETGFDVYTPPIKVEKEPIEPAFDKNEILDKLDKNVLYSFQTSGSGRELAENGIQDWADNIDKEETIEQHYEMPVATDLEQFDKNIDTILWNYTDRKAAFNEVAKYIGTYNEQFGKKWLALKGITNKEIGEVYLKNRQTKVRAKTIAENKKQSREFKADVAVENIEIMVEQQTAEWDAAIAENDAKEQQQEDIRLAELENKLIANKNNENDTKPINEQSVHTKTPIIIEKNNDAESNKSRSIYHSSNEVENKTEMTKQKGYNYEAIKAKFEELSKLNVNIDVLYAAVSATLEDAGIDTTEYQKRFTKEYLLDLPSKLPLKNAKLYLKYLPIGEQKIVPVHKEVAEVKNPTIKDELKILAPICVKDDFRPAMSGVYFDVTNKRMVATDAHVLVIINDNRLEGENRVENKKYTSTDINKKFPQYQDVIPYNNPYIIKLNVQDVYDIANGVERANKFLDTVAHSQIFISIVVDGSHWLFAPDTIIRTFKVLLEFGYKEVEMTLSTPMRVVMIETPKVTCLIMPILNVNDEEKYVTVFNGKSLQKEEIDEPILPVEIKIKAKERTLDEIGTEKRELRKLREQALKKGNHNLASEIEEKIEKLNVESDAAIDKMKDEEISKASVADFKRFEDVVKNSKDFNDAFLKVQEIKNIPYGVSVLFRSKYDPTGSLTPKETFRKFYDEVKNEKSIFVRLGSHRTYDKVFKELGEDNIKIWTSFKDEPAYEILKQDYEKIKDIIGVVLLKNRIDKDEYRKPLTSKKAENQTIQEAKKAKQIIDDLKELGKEFETFKSNFKNNLPHYDTNIFEVDSLVGVKIKMQHFNRKDTVLGENSSATIGYKMTYINLSNPKNVVKLIENYGTENEAYERAFELYKEYLENEKQTIEVHQPKEVESIANSKPNKVGRKAKEGEVAEQKIIANNLPQATNKELTDANKVFKGSYYGLNPKNALTKILGAISIYERDYDNEQSKSIIKELNRIANSYKEQLGIGTNEQKLEKAAEPTNENESILKKIKALQILSNMGDESATKKVKALKLLIN